MNKLPFLRPKYLLDLKKWQIRLFDQCWKNEEELKKNGYGAISYAWGQWKDRSTSALINERGYPTFDIGQKDNKPLLWRFPIVRAKPGEPAEQFTIGEARNTLKRMGMRFVWWDWACIPQGLSKAEKPGDEDYEVNKMRYVYPFSKRGTIWAHSVRWQDDSALKTALVDCCNYSATQTGTYKKVSAVKKVVKALQEAHKAEPWLQSLWCFQEGVLFSHPSRRPDAASGVFRDREGNSLNVPSIRGEGDLWDLVIAASEISSTIVNILRHRAEAPEENPFLNFPEPLDSADPYFTVWCKNPKNEQAARQMFDNLVKTGLVFYTSQSPLSLLNARWNRGRDNYTKLADVVVNTVIGALELNIEKYQEEAEGKPDAEKLAIQREGMLVELFDNYQWRMLLFAKERLEKPQPDMSGVWSNLVDVKELKQKVPLFTSLEYFLSTIHLSKRFKPPTPRYEGDLPPPDLRPPVDPPKGQFALPTLKYSRKHKYLTMQKLQGFKLFDLTKYDVSNPLWTKCIFYAQAGAGKGVFMPAFKQVGFKEWADEFGDNAVLVPLENLPKTSEDVPWERVDRLRCVVLNNFGKASDLGYPLTTETLRAATFVGVVDLEVDLKHRNGNLELKEDITLY